MRFAGDLIRQGNPNDTISPESMDEVYRFQDRLRNEPEVPKFNSEDLQMTPEMTPGRSFDSPFEHEHLRDKYILHNPGSGVAMLPNGEQGPSQGPNTPIKNYDGQFMPNGSEPSGYKPSPNSLMAFNPTMLKLQLLKQALQGQPVNPGTRMSPKTYQEIYEPELTEPHKIESPIDRNYMEVMKSGFV